MRRFFVEPGLLQGSSGIISGELCRHLSTVLRLKPGTAIRLADGSGHEGVATITVVAKEGIHVDIVACATDNANGSCPQITLYQGLPKGEKLDLILQKCTELGVASIVPFMAARSVTRLEGERLDNRIARWQKIALEAARQSGREDVPQIGFANDMADVLHRENGSLRLILWEDEKEQGLQTVLEASSRPESIAIIIGPEGGLTASETGMATAAGYLPVTLGKRILRTETAGLAVVSILQYLWGDLG
jgi:16S rRNA (uracil1498-N3)-methyltransferase